MAAERLITPPKLKNGTMRIVPLGGLGEVGRNMAVFELDGKILIVDCGVLFPEEEQPGVDSSSRTSATSRTVWTTSSAGAHPRA